MGIPTTIDNDPFDPYHVAGILYYTRGEEYFECEQARREKSWQSSAILTGLGLVVTTLYYNEYSDVVDKRNELNDKIYACALKEHEHWRDHTFPHATKTFDWVQSVAEVVPNYAAPTGVAPTSQFQSGVSGWLQDDDCHTCSTSPELAAEARLADLDSRAFLMRNQQRREEYRREFKASGMSAVDKAGKNLGAPGRQALGVGLNIINTLVAMAASGMNGGMNTLGSGLADLGNSQWGSSQ